MQWLCRLDPGAEQARAASLPSRAGSGRWIGAERRPCPERCAQRSIDYFAVVVAVVVVVVAVVVVAGEGWYESG